MPHRSSYVLRHDGVLAGDDRPLGMRLALAQPEPGQFT
jgi:hypothetical protein